MILVRKINGAWTMWAGKNEPMKKIVSVANVQYADGRQEEISVSPYEMEALLSSDAVCVNLAHGVWTDSDLAPFGLKVATPFVPPDGKRATGAARYEEQSDGTVAEVFDVEDVPPPPPPPTLEQVLAVNGFSLDDLAAAVAAKQAQT
jgi:hypothetical protein